MSDELGEILGTVEYNQLQECERIIEEGYTAFLKVGSALIKVRDSRLYRTTHQTFEAYCEKRWGFTRTRAYELMSAANISQAVSEISDIPVTSESHAKALRGLDPETAAEVMERATETGTVTATSIREARKEIAPESATVTTTETVTTERQVDLNTGEIIEPKPLIGLDGKTYERPKPKPAPEFTDDELALLNDLKEGKTVVLNMRADTHSRLWAWAENNDLAVRIDRKSQWGNPFVLGEDGDREQVIGKYATYYFPHKPQLVADIGDLKGKALGCWCAPDRCHGDVLARVAQ